MSKLVTAPADPKDLAERHNHVLQRFKRPLASIAAVLMALAGLQMVKSVRNEFPPLIRAWRVAAGIATIQ